MNTWRGFVAVLIVACLTQGAAAADRSLAALPNAAQLDEDFYLQGEYAGSLTPADCDSGAIGVQVIALGDGNFKAVEYSGGLPGNGWDRRSRRKYSGKLVSAGKAELASDNGRLLVRPGLIVATDSAGNLRGRLSKTLRMSQTLRAAPPADAKVLFSGRDGRHFSKGVVTADHLLAAGTDTREPVGDFTMHLEFRTPYMPRARDQGRGNSGVYIQGRYEVQILDSFGLEGAFNECGSLYRQRAPLVNMAFPPLAWQTYDIDFTAPRFDSAGKKTSNARLTLRHNGVVVQNDVEITAKTGAGAAEGPDPRPIKLQDHGNPVHFRNIWIVERKASAVPCDCLVQAATSIRFSRNSQSSPAGTSAFER